MDRSGLRSLNIALFAVCIGYSTNTFAQEAPGGAPPAADASVPALPVAKPKPPPYSLPWQLRPAVVGNVVRSDTSFAFYKDAAGKESGSTVASMLLLSYKITDELAPMVRVGMVSNSPPSSLLANMVPVDSAVNFLNPVIGATYAVKPAKPLRLAFFLGVTLPIGGGGGDQAKVENKTANAMGIRARSAMDNAMFSVNDVTVFPGVDLAYVSGGFTAQIEATLLQLMRVRGDQPNAMGVANNPDKAKTNFTMGLHLGYFLTPFLSVGTEFRHQRFLSSPKAVKDDEASMAPLGLRDTTTFAMGPRFHIKISDSVWFRPGVAFAMATDKPLEKFDYKIVQLDLPIAF